MAEAVETARVVEVAGMVELATGDEPAVKAEVVDGCCCGCSCGSEGVAAAADPRVVWAGVREAKAEGAVA